MLNRRWRKRIIDTEYINERAITTTILVNRQHIKLINVYFTHSKYADDHIDEMYKTIENHMVHNNKYIPIIGGDFNAELGPGKGTERKSVGRYTHNESNKRGDWLKSWLMLNDYSALNTMFRKTPQKQTSFVSQKGKETRIDYILTKRRYLRNVKDAEANDMIHMGSDHRCVMATFLINMLEKDTHAKKIKEKHETIGYNEHKQTEKKKNINIEMSELGERYQEIVDTIKKAAAKKRNEVHDTRNNAKDQVESENAAAAEAECTLTEAEAQEIAATKAESTLAEAVPQEIERRSMKRSSTVANQRGVPAQHEHRRQEGWTPTPRGSDDEKKSSERDMLAGERLPKQRPQGDDHPEHNPEEHLVAQVPRQDEEAGSIKEARVMAYAAARGSEDFPNKDAEIPRLTEERRSTHKEEKQRLKDLSKCIKNA